MMLAVLPFNGAQEELAPIARQIAFFLCDILREQCGAEYHPINYLVQINENPPRYGNINPSQTLNEYPMLQQFFGEEKVKAVIDGLLKKEKDQFELTIRLLEKNKEEATRTEIFSFNNATLFKTLGEIAGYLAKIDEKIFEFNAENPAGYFGTENPEAFLQFVIGYDSLQYINRANGQVDENFDPEQALNAFTKACQLDNNWEGPYLGLIQLCRVGIQLRLGEAGQFEQALKQIIELYPKDGRALFVLGEYYEALQDLKKASEVFEKAHLLDPKEPLLLTRLGLIQIAMNMPVNAERNFKKALELEGPEKPTANHLANVLMTTGRAHEVVDIWKKIAEEYPENVDAQIKHAISVIELKKDPEAGFQIFEKALQEVSQPLQVKRYYAIFLARKDDLDRAMDYYEDYLDENPTDVDALIEYAQVLKKAKRDFEIPKILKDILSLNLNPNQKAEIQAWLIELEQPKRVECIESAQKKLQQQDPESALKELLPLKTWLGDYWKFWSLLTTAYNMNGKFKEAEESAIHLLNMYPGCEPAYGDLVNALGMQGRQEDAYNMMRNVATQINNSITIAIHLGIAAKNFGKNDEAKSIAKQIREAIGQNQELEPVLAHLES